VIGGRAVPALLVPWARVSAMLGDLAGRYRRAWKGGYVESPDILLTEVVGLLSGLRLAQPTDGGLAIFPFAARYQPQVTTRPSRQTEGYDR
jgi:hypothetical protein